MAYGGPLLYAWIGFILRCAETERVGKGRGVAGSNREALRATVVRRPGLCGEGVGHIASCLYVAGALERYHLSFLLRFALFFPPCFFLVEQSSLFSPSPSFFFFLFIPQWRSLILQAGSNRLLFVSRWQPTVLCSLTPPSNKAPSHNTDTPTILSSKWVNSSGTNTLAT